ncbi:MAG: GtrA family protein [Syntrophotalea sp.]|uniref:GtrA family protein n=1 Tax=Syntrophotalea sp. TaxID=2812029 RepID=UPI003D153243
MISDTRRKLLRFGMVGIANTLVDYAILNLLVLALGIFSPVGLVLCNIAAFFGANLNSYVLNKRWTFEDRSHWSKKEYLLFLFCSLGGLGINCLVLYFLSSGVFPEAFSFFVHLNLAKLSASVASMVWNFYAYKVFVFSPRIGADEGASGHCGERVKSALR